MLIDVSIVAVDRIDDVAPAARASSSFICMLLPRKRVQTSPFATAEPTELGREEIGGPSKGAHT